MMIPIFPRSVLDGISLPLDQSFADRPTPQISFLYFLISVWESFGIPPDLQEQCLRHLEDEGDQVHILT